MRIAAAALLVLAACTEQPTPTSGRRLTAHVEVAVYPNLSNAPPVAGAKVAFVDPDGTGTILVTGADGIARAEMTPGGSVTALVPLVPAGNPPYLSTVLDVQDGDHIGLGMPPLAPIAPAPPGPPSCAQAALTATYTGADAAGLTGISLERMTDADQTFADAGPGPYTPTTTIAIAGAAATRAFVRTAVAGNGDCEQQWVLDAIDGCATSYAVDLGDQLLPWVGAPTLDASLGVIHVPITGAGGGDLLDAWIGYEHAGSYVNWDVASPHAGDILLPILPGELAALMPAPDDKLTSASAWLLDDDAIHGYDEARTRAHALGLAADNMQGSSTARARASYCIKTY